MAESHPSASSAQNSKLKDSWLEEEVQQEAILDLDVLSNQNGDGNPDSPDTLSDSAYEKQRERRAVVAGIAGGFAGLVLLGPVSGVAAGVAGALLSKRMNQKREITPETARNETELASLISPKPQI